MGNLYSHYPKSKYEEMEGSHTPSTPAQEMDAQQSKNFLSLLDPRSPTMGVSRTPVEVVAERERTRQERAKRLQGLGLANPNAGIPTISTEAEAHTPSTFINPRSPTFEYKRTPIALDGTPVRESCDDLMEVDTTPCKNDTELQVPTASSQLNRDLRKRLFVEKLNESIPTGVPDDNKEN